MIVKMRKMDLLLYHREQDKFLEELRNLGVVHITSTEGQADSPAAQELRAEVQRVQRIAAALNKQQAEKKIAALDAAPGDVPGLLARYEECEAKRDRLEQEIASLNKDRNALAAWGDFDPQNIRRLAEAGVGMKFYTVPSKKLKQYDMAKLGIEVISDIEGIVRFVTVFRGEAPEVPGAEEARLPDISLRALAAKIEETERERAGAGAEIEKLAGALPAIEAYRNDRLNSLKYEEARLSMTGAAEGRLLKLSGWVTKQSEAKVAAFLQGYPAYVTFRDPTADDTVPVLLKNNKFSKPFEAILGLYSLPGYRELDYTPFAAPFFAFFFGLCLGDAGYGLIYIIASLIGLAKVGPKMRPIMKLGLTFGIATTICGVLLNGFFGLPIFQVEGMKEGTALFAAGGEMFAPLASFETSDGSVFPAMSLALLIGFVHMFFGMFIHVYTQARDRGIAATILPLSCIVMVVGSVMLGAHPADKGGFMGLGIGGFAVGKWHVGALLLMVPHDVAKWMAIGGIAGALLFNSLDKPIYIRPLTGLWELYNFASGFFSNILSYLRLFALGLAGGLLGTAINDIACMFIKGADGGLNFASVGVVATVIIVVLGHVINMALASLGAFVHPLRLMFVEFYGAVKFQGGGRAYRPFAKVEN